MESRPRGALPGVISFLPWQDEAFLRGPEQATGAEIAFIVRLWLLNTPFCLPWRRVRYLTGPGVRDPVGSVPLEQRNHGTRSRLILDRSHLIYVGLYS